MIWFLVWCVVGIGMVALLISGMCKTSVKNFESKYNLKKKKKSLIQKFKGRMWLLICCFTPIVQLFIILLMIIGTVVYSSQNEEIVAKWKESYKEG